MKKLSILITVLFLCLGGYAQKQKKPKITKANAAREKGDLATAKEIIDLAIEHEKTKDDGKTWYYRALIYASLDTTSNPQYSNLAENPLQEAMRAFAKADELGEEGKDYFLVGDYGIVSKSQQIDGYYSYYYNQGVEAFQAEDYPVAVDFFETASLINPADTGTYINAAFAAHNGELYDKALANYKKAIEMGATSKDLFYNTLNILTTVKNDNEAALEFVTKAREQFPNDGALAKNQINLMLLTDRIEEARTNLEAAIAAEPDNASLYFTLGVLHEELGNEEAAFNAYDKALQVDPNHYESSFNKGVMLIEQANEIIKQRNNLGMSKADLKKSKELEPRIREKLKAAMPQWEKTVELKPDDRQALEMLEYIYTQLEMDDKAKAIGDKLDNMN